MFLKVQLRLSRIDWVPADPNGAGRSEAGEYAGYYEACREGSVSDPSPMRGKKKKNSAMIVRTGFRGMPERDTSSTSLAIEEGSENGPTLIPTPVSFLHHIHHRLTLAIPLKLGHEKRIACSFHSACCMTVRAHEHVFERI